MDNNYTPNNIPLDFVNNLRNKWNELRNVTQTVASPPLIQYMFYGYATSYLEKMIVVEDINNNFLSPVIVATKLVDKSGTPDSSAYAIVQSKTMVLEMGTGREITALGDSLEVKMEKIALYYNYIRGQYPNVNPYDLLCYYVPRSSLAATNLHCIYHQKVTTSRLDNDAFIAEIKAAKTTQAKRILIGFFMLSRFWSSIFNAPIV